MKIGRFIHTLFYSIFLYNTNSHVEELLLNFRELHGEHTGENLAAAVWATLKLYGLKGQVGFFFSLYSYLTNSHSRSSQLYVTMPETMTQ